MQVDIKKKQIIVKYNGKLNPLVNQQFKFYGFKKNLGNFLLTKELENLKEVKKYTHYLDKKNVSYELTNRAQHCLSLLEKKSKSLKKAKILGSRIKDGKIEIAKFKKFQKFLYNELPRDLRDHQLKSAFHLYQIEKGANYSVPGSGKTTVVLSVFEKLRKEEKVNRVFVVGPPSSFEPWKEEFKLALGRKPKYKVLSGGLKSRRIDEYYNANSEYDLLLTTYQTLLNDHNDVVEYFKFKKIKPFLVIDEAHYIKQIEGSWAKAVLSLSYLTEFKCLLTGTPIPKSYTDLFNQYEFLWPNCKIFDQKTRFKIQNAESKDDFETASSLIENKIGPLFYRVRKKDLGLEPQVFHDPIKIKMNKYESLLYNSIEKRISVLDKKTVSRNWDFIQKLKRGRIIRLRQCVSFAKMLSTAIEEYDEDLIESDDLRRKVIEYDKIEIPAKLEYLIKFAKDTVNDGDKLVIWSHFIGSIELIEKHIKSIGLSCASIYGATPVERNASSEVLTREKIIRSFKNNTGIDILIANPAACAESISLHKVCNNAIYYDLSYNCAQYLQSLDRIHRVGGSEEKPSYYYFLQYEDTFEDDILSNLKTKSQKMENVVEEEYELYSLKIVLGDEDIEAYDRLFKK